MALIDGFKKWVTANEDDYEDGYEDHAPQKSKSFDLDDEYIAPKQKESKKNKVVNINATAQLAVVLVKPEKFSDVAEIADNLKNKRTVVLNVEKTDRDIARRIVDFLSGVAYASEGNIKKVAEAIFIITPYNVDIMGDLMDELESSGLCS